MARNNDWQDYVDPNGDFQLTEYLYVSILDTMKTALDLGTLLSNDPVKLRAYKEQIKSSSKGCWMDIAAALEYYGILEPCGCSTEFCRTCNGRRYLSTGSVSAEEIRSLEHKLDEGLRKVWSLDE